MSIAIACFVGAMFYAGFMDVMSMTIDNTLILFLGTVGAVAAPFAGMNLEDLGYSVLAALLVFFFCVAFHVMGWIGGGDGKLATVTAFWMGAEHAYAYAYIFYAAVFGGVLTVCILLFRRWPLPQAWRTRFWVARLHSRQNGVPYGVALALAGLFAIKDTAWVTALT